MVMLEFSLIPLDKGPSIGAQVARSLEIIDGSELDYRLGPMGTTIEGTWDEVFGVVKRCFERAAEDCDRMNLSIRVDYRKGATGRLGRQAESVEKRVGRKLRG
jgi:uncharacterized protein (TIGR00106 family)